MKEPYHRIALAVGGSHYPDVGGDLLERFADALVKECLEVIAKTPVHCAITTYDLGTVDCTINKTIELVSEHFGQTPHRYAVNNAREFVDKNRSSL